MRIYLNFISTLRLADSELKHTRKWMVQWSQAEFLNLGAADTGGLIILRGGDCPVH